MAPTAYPRSYCFAADALPEPCPLPHVPTPAGWLRIAPGYAICSAGDAGVCVILIGHAIDLDAPGQPETKIAAGLLRRLKTGVDALLAATDGLLGRFVVLARRDGRWIALSDACATRTLYYSETRPLIASHSTYIGAVEGREPQTELFRNFRAGLPGARSPVPGVRILPANFYLDLDARTPRRFWPRAPRVEASVADVFPAFARTLEASAAAIAARWRPIISATAGIDSRVTLTAFQGARDALAFTYNRSAEDKADAAIAPQVCRALALEHRELTPPRREDARDAFALLEGMVDHKHSNPISAIFKQHLAVLGGVHVRSNLAEIGRAFWRGHPAMPRSFAPGNWVRTTMNKDRKLPGRAEAEALMREEMAAFVAMAGYDPHPRDPRLLGYDAWDLIYWEHRMATWHGPVLLGSDIAFDTQIVFNSRRLLAAMLSVPLADRASAALFRRFFAEKAPALLKIPINPREARPLWRRAPNAFRRMLRLAERANLVVRYAR